MRKIVVYMGDERIYPMLVSSCKSLLYHTKVDRVVFLIDTPTFPLELPRNGIVQTLNVHDQRIFHPHGPNHHNHYGYMTLMRAALSKLFPDEDTVLLLDPDTVVVDDISPVWSYDISDYYLAAVEETRFYNQPHSIHKKVPYYNAGVMLMNLAKLRADKIDDTIIQTINTTPYEHLEQDVINFVCDKHILPLPSDYNVSFVTDPSDHPRIRHCLSFAKHEFPHYVEPYNKLSWNDILKRGEQS